MTGKDDWGTDQKLYDILHQEFSFTLDACADERNAKCKDYLSQEINALEVDWWGRVFMNPPFSKTAEFLEKMMVQLDEEHIELGVALIAARTDTTSFHYAQIAAGETRFLRGRCRYEIYPSPEQRGACTEMKDWAIEPDGWYSLTKEIGLPKVAIQRLMKDPNYQGPELSGSAPFPSAVLVFDRRPVQSTIYWDWRKEMKVAYAYEALPVLSVVTLGEGLVQSEVVEALKKKYGG